MNICLFAFEEIETIIRGNVFCSVCLLTPFQVVFFSHAGDTIRKWFICGLLITLHFFISLNYRRLNLRF